MSKQEAFFIEEIKYSTKKIRNNKGLIFYVACSFKTNNTESRE